MSEPRDMDAPVTRREMHEALETWAGAIINRLTTDIIGQVKGLLEALELRLMGELRSQGRGAAKDLEGRLVAIEEPYKDLPARVTKLETKVFAPSRRKRR